VCLAALTKGTNGGWDERLTTIVFRPHLVIISTTKEPSVTQRFLKNLARLKQVAAEGHAGATRLLGDRHSVGLTRDKKAAFAWYLKSARPGEPIEKQCGAWVR
jgi:hypothetical protein